MPAQQKEIIPVQMGSVPEKCTLVDCLSHPFPSTSRQVTATQDKSHLLLVIAQSVVLLFTGLLLMGDFALDCVQVDLFLDFGRDWPKSRCNFYCSALTSYYLLKH